MKRIHGIGGLTISIFIGLHLFNHLYSLMGANAHIELMNNLRMIYRNRIAETILLLAILIQIFSGVKLFLKKRKTVTDIFERLQIVSGLYLAFFLVIHVGVVLTGRYLLELDTNFYFGVAGLNTFPINLFFIPYYGLAILSFFGHIAAMHSKKMKQNIFGLSPGRQSIAILFFGLILTIIIFYGLTNEFSGVTIPKEYEVLIGN